MIVKLCKLSVANVDEIAEEALRGVTDKGGRPLIEHSRAVAAGVAGFGAAISMAALLHDVVEDTKLEPEDLVNMGIPWPVVHTVIGLTFERHRHDSYRAYLENVARRTDLLLIKIADNAHNSRADRLENVDPFTRTRLVEKYRDARNVLWPRAAIDDLESILFRVNPELLKELNELDLV